MKPADGSTLAINAGSSSIEFALYEGGAALEKTLHGEVDRIGLGGTTLDWNGETRDLPAAGSARW